MELSAHAYLIQGTSSDVPHVLALLQRSGIETEANADLLWKSYVSFSMEDARQLRDRALLRGVQGPRVFVIAAPTIPPDAQNALLKTFEEPSAGAKFFLIVPAPDTLLPTLRSRMQMLTLQDAAPIESLVDTKKFLAATGESRIALLKPFLEKDDDDKRDLSGTITFLSELERTLSKDPKMNGEGLRAVYRARKYITDRGALAKALLEQVALLS